MTVRSGFLFIAGHPALDFVNTEIVRDGQRVDLLDDPLSLPRWLVAAKLAGPARPALLRPSALAAAKRVRAALRDIAGALADGKPVRRAAVAALDRELRRVWGSLTLGQAGRAFSLAFEPNRAEAGDPRYLVARAAAAFLTGAHLTRVRRCEGTNCILFFLDTTRSHTRRWCSMAVCGNRRKAALHYRRRRSS